MAINTYSFDENVILDLCVIDIPNSHQIYFDQKSFKNKNFFKINTLISKLDDTQIPKYRFEPSAIEKNAIKRIHQMLEGYQIDMLGTSFRSVIMEQLLEFRDQVIKNFEKIEKDKDIGRIKQIFLENERELIRDKNLPEDDDLEIISGYMSFEGGESKFLISGDEHFWGYEEIINDHFKIKVIRTKNCNNVFPE